MKAASDMGLPLVGVGLLYRPGYFKQYLNPDGFQQESYPENDWYNMPVRSLSRRQGQADSHFRRNGGQGDCSPNMGGDGRSILLFLLDTNIEENAAEDRAITAALYGGDSETRVRQEILLGVGGIRALRALGVDVVVTHMNEGHSAFLALERIRK